MSCREIPINTQSELVACCISLTDSQSLIVCSVYRPPTTNASSLQQLCRDLDDLLSEHSDVPVWIAGDLNLPDINWNNCAVEGTSYPVSLSNIFLDFISTYGMTQTVNFPTRINNILDIFCFCILNQCYPIPGIGDHDTVMIESSTTVQNYPPSKRTIYLWTRANLDDIKQKLLNLCALYLTHNTISTPVTILWDDFKSICYECLDMIPVKEVSSNSKLIWINRIIKRLSRKKQKLYNKARASKTPDDWSIYQAVKQKLQQEC